MTIGFLVEYLANTEILTQIRDLFVNLCGLDLEVLTLDGTLVESGAVTPSVDHSSQARICPHCQEPHKSCFRNRAHIFDEIAESKEPKRFMCEQGYQRILVPVILNGQVVACLHTGETAQFRLNGLQIHTITMVLQKIVDKIIQMELKSFSEFKGGKLTHQQKMLRKVVQYIEENYHAPDLSLRDISEKNGISYHYLSRIFKKEFNTTFAQYRNKVRLDVAAKLLQDRSLTVSQISYSCGFDDPGYFCKVFKDTFGASPVDFRNRPEDGDKKEKHGKKARMTASVSFPQN